MAAVHGIRKFLWDTILKNNILGDSTQINQRYGTIVPIIPVKQTPEFQKEMALKGSPPYIVYNWNTDESEDSWFIESDQIVFLMYAASSDELTRLVNFVKELFKMRDESAMLVNNYIDQLADNINLSRFQYTSISVLTSGAPLPIEQEGGLSEAMVTIRAQYTQAPANLSF